MSDPSELEIVQLYRQRVLEYEALDAEIDALIMAHGGATENMPWDVLHRYRKLAQKRDEIQNEMRTLEQRLQLDE